MRPGQKPKSFYLQGNKTHYILALILDKNGITIRLYNLTFIFILPNHCYQKIKLKVIKKSINDKSQLPPIINGTNNQLLPKLRHTNLDSELLTKLLTSIIADALGLEVLDSILVRGVVRYGL